MRLERKRGGTRSAPTVTCTPSISHFFQVQTAKMSGISFKITAPGRPTSVGSNAPPSRSTSSRQHSYQRGGAVAETGDDSEDDDDDDDDAFRRASGRDNKRRKVDQEEVIEFGKDGATR